MQALVFEEKTIELFNYGAGDQTSWWSLFDLLKFALLFGTSALKMILERRCVDTNMEGEVSSEVSTITSPKNRLYKALLISITAAKQLKRVPSFSNAYLETSMCGYQHGR